MGASEVPARPRPAPARVVLVLAVVVAVLLFVSGYTAFATIDLTAEHPLSLPAAMLTAFAVFSVAAFLLFVAAFVLFCRRRRGAGPAAVVAFLLPAAATVAAVYLGVLTLEQTATENLNSTGALVVRIGDLLDRWGAPGGGPVRDVGHVLQG